MFLPSDSLVIASERCLTLMAERQLVPSRYSYVFEVREDWGLRWGAQGVTQLPGLLRLMYENYTEQTTSHKTV